MHVERLSQLLWPVSDQILREEIDEKIVARSHKAALQSVLNLVPDRLERTEEAC